MLVDLLFLAMVNNKKHVLDIRSRSSNQHLKGSLLGDPFLNRRVVVSNGVLIELYSQVLGLASLERHLFKRGKLLLRAGQLRLLVVHVNLYRLETVNVSDVGHGHNELDGSIRREHLGAQRWPTVLKGRV